MQHWQSHTFSEFSYSFYFSTLAISLLNSIGDFLESGIDEYTTNLYDWTTEPDTDESSNEDSYEGSYEEKSYEPEEIDFEVSETPKTSDFEVSQTPKTKSNIK